MLISLESADLISSEISTIMRKPAFLINESGAVISSTSPEKYQDSYPELFEQFRQGCDYVTTNASPDGTVNVCFPIWLKQRIVGAVGIVCAESEQKELVTYYSDTIQRIAEVRIQRLSRRMSRDEEQGYFDRARQIFFESTLFSGTLSEFLNDDEVIFRASLLGIDLSLPRVILMLGFDSLSQTPEDTKNVRSHIIDYSQYLKQNISARQQQDFCFVDEQHVMVLFCSNSSQQVLERSARLCEDLENFYSIRVYGGISTVAASPPQFQRCYNEAQTACEIAQRSPAKKLLIYNVTSPRFIAQSIPSDIKSSLVKAVFSGLSKEDVQETVDLVHAYWHAHGNIEQAAAALFIHRNTFLYRINKTRTLTGLNIKDPKDLMVLYLACFNLTS